MLIDVSVADAQARLRSGEQAGEPKVIHVVGPLICRNCLISQTRYIKSLGIGEQYVAAISVETRMEERTILHNDSALVSDIVTVTPIRKKSETYTPIEQFMKNITSNQTLGILVLLPDGTGQFFEYASSFGEHGKILPDVATRLRDLLGRVKGQALSPAE